MRARPGWQVVALVLAARGAIADPEPKAIDIKPFRDQLQVLRDEHGGTYVVLRDGDTRRAWYGTGTTLYEQLVVTSGSDGSTGAWDISVFVPRMSGFIPGTIRRNDDGSYMRYCTSDAAANIKLVPLPADQSKHLLDRATLKTTALIRKPHLLARDDSGVYYYVDELRKDYGEGSYRVLVGKKGAMQQLPLTDIATDSAGEVFATKSGDLRLVKNNDDDGKRTIAWVQGGRRTSLFLLPPEQNGPLIYRGLGVYPFVGTICDEL